MPPFGTKYALVYVWLGGHGRRVSGLRLDGAVNGMVRVFVRGRTHTVPAASVSRARRSLAARALHIRLSAEYGRLLSAMEGLEPRMARGRGGRTEMIRASQVPAGATLENPTATLQSASSPSPAPAAPAGTTSHTSEASNLLPQPPAGQIVRTNRPNGDIVLSEVLREMQPDYLLPDPEQLSLEVAEQDPLSLEGLAAQTQGLIKLIQRAREAGDPALVRSLRRELLATRWEFVRSTRGGRYLAVSQRVRRVVKRRTRFAVNGNPGKPPTSSDRPLRSNSTPA